MLEKDPFVIAMLPRKLSTGRGRVVSSANNLCWTDDPHLRPNPGENLEPGSEFHDIETETYAKVDTVIVPERKGVSSLIHRYVQVALHIGAGLDRGTPDIEIRGSCWRPGQVEETEMEVMAAPRPVMGIYSVLAGGCVQAQDVLEIHNDACPWPVREIGHSRNS